MTDDEVAGYVLTDWTTPGEYQVRMYPDKYDGSEDYTQTVKIPPVYCYREGDEVLKKHIETIFCQTCFNPKYYDAEKEQFYCPTHL